MTESKSESNTTSQLSKSISITIPLKPINDYFATQSKGFTYSVEKRYREVIVQVSWNKHWNAQAIIDCTNDEMFDPDIVLLHIKDMVQEVKQMVKRDVRGLLADTNGFTPLYHDNRCSPLCDGMGHFECIHYHKWFNAQGERLDECVKEFGNA